MHSRALESCLHTVEVPYSTVRAYRTLWVASGTTRIGPITVFANMHTIEVLEAEQLLPYRTGIVGLQCQYLRNLLYRQAIVAKHV